MRSRILPRPGSMSLFVAVTATLVVLLVTNAWAVTLYSVRAKDTVARIARRHGVSVDRILRANPELRDRPQLKIGQIVIIPDADESSRVVEDADPAVSAPSVATAPSAPAPAPTPMSVETGDRVVNEPGFENIGVVNPETVEVALNSDTYKRSPLSSRRGRLLTYITSMARRFMGVPYVWGGTTSRGYDCSGFTMTMYRLAGINIKRLADEQYYQGHPTSTPVAGDLVFFTTYLPGPSHVGIYLGNNLFIHASSRRGVTVSSLNDSFFKKRYLGARSFF